MSEAGKRSGNLTLIFWGLFFALAILAISFLVTSRAGDSPRKQVEAVPDRLVVVRADVLAARHPMQAEVTRLREAEARLRRIDAQGEVGLTGSARLEPVGPVDSAVSARLRSEMLARLADERVETEQEARRGIALYERGRGDRLDRLVERLRVEKRAEISARDEAAYRAKRDAIDRRTVESLASLMSRRATLRAEQETLDAQLDPGSLVLPPVSDPEKLERDVTTVALPNLSGTALTETTPGTLPGYVAPFTLRSVSALVVERQTYGIGMRPRLEYRRRLARERLELLDREINDLIARGDAEKLALEKKSDAEREAEVESAVKALRDSQTVAPVEGALERLRNALDREERLDSARTARTVGSMSPIETLTVSAQGSGATGRNAAADRLARRRNELERWIEEVVSEMVRDVGTNRKWDVAVARSAQEAKSAQESGRSDVTREFARWMASGANATDTP